MVSWSDLKNIDKVENTQIEDDLNINEMFSYKEEEQEFFFATKEQLKQYSNEVLYTFEKRFLEWAEIKMQDENFTKNGKKGIHARSFTISMILQELYGRPWDNKLDQKYRNIYIRVVSYYSSKINKGYWSSEKQKSVNKSYYTLSVARIKKCVPYSLRLRYEVLCKQGIMPSNDKMELPKDDLKPGHARYWRSEKKKQQYKEEGKKRYEKWINENKRAATKEK